MRGPSFQDLPAGGRTRGLGLPAAREFGTSSTRTARGGLRSAEHPRLRQILRPPPPGTLALPLWAGYPSQEGRASNSGSRSTADWGCSTDRSATLLPSALARSLPAQALAQWGARGCAGRTPRRAYRRSNSLALSSAGTGRRPRTHFRGVRSRSLRPLQTCFCGARCSPGRPRCSSSTRARTS